jgi:hypothetical protein
MYGGDTMNVNVLLSGRLKIDGYGKGRPENGDGTYRLNLAEGSTVKEVIQGMNVPQDKVALMMVNARKSEVTARVKAEDRVILIPSDVALLWRHLGMMNLGAESVFDF